MHMLTNAVVICSIYARMFGGVEASYVDWTESQCGAFGLSTGGSELPVGAVSVFPAGFTLLRFYY